MVKKKTSYRRSMSMFPAANNYYEIMSKHKN